jgi:hypothetical protein
VAVLKKNFAKKELITLYVLASIDLLVTIGYAVDFRDARPLFYCALLARKHAV